MPAPHQACGNCGHLWKSAVDAASAERYYATLEGRNAGSPDLMERRLRDRMNTLSGLLRERMRVIEIGCAEGALGARVKAHTPLDYTGIEPSRDAAAAGRVLDHVLPRIPPGLEGEPYDLVLAFHVLEHIADIAAETARWRSLLKTDGLAVVEVPRGAGHPLLSWDANAEHLHQFTAASLTALLQRSDLEAVALTSGHFESAVYCDSLRLVARAVQPEAARRHALVERFRARFPGRFAVYGLGGDFRNYVQPLLGELAVDALIDSDAKRHGERIAGLAVEPFDRTRHAGMPVLVASLRYRGEIAARLTAQGVPSTAIVGLEEIYGGAA
jgi:SAM-dependent methyltransferase